MATRVAFLSIVVCFACISSSCEFDGYVGPAGGWVFYPGLEAAPVDCGGWEYWGESNTVTGAKATAVGSGSSNTDKIVATYGTLSYNYAAKLCADFEYNGYTDWYLPSLEELDLMRINMYDGGVDDFNAGSSYWSSSEDGGANGAHYVRFSDGGRVIVNKNTDDCHVRAIRTLR